MVPNARWVIQRREWEAASRAENHARFQYHSHQYDLGHDRLEADGEHDLFDDGSVVCIPSFGHTPGHQSLKVRLPDGDVVICSDACYMRETLEKMHLPAPGVTSDAEQMLSTLQMFRRLQDAGAELIFGHDPDQWKQLNEGPLREITAARQAAPRLGA
jgi:glyoxylase-like metal-dependent hydrolase (beta-lactamase superfamily II)